MSTNDDLPPLSADMTDREAFEDWARGNFGRGKVVQASNGPYVWDDVQASWVTWQAAIASQASEIDALRAVPEGWHLVPKIPTPDISSGSQAAEIAALREALDWYADEARACARNSHSGKHSAGEALMASVTVLALDGGKRADAAMAAHKEPSNG